MYRTGARVFTRPRMSQVGPPFPIGTPEFIRWRNIVHLNGMVGDILGEIFIVEEADPSMKEKLSAIKEAVIRLRTKLDYYDGQGTQEIGQPC